MHKEPISSIVGLKALAWDFNNSVFTSPARPEFIWSPGGLQMCECPKCGGEPKQNCTCGLYATFKFGVAMEYTQESIISPIFLTEASGVTHVYSEGFRSEELTIHAVSPINDSALAKLCASQAADYFGIKIVPDYRVLWFFMDVLNLYTCKDTYVPALEATKSLTGDSLDKVMQLIWRTLGENPN